MMTGLFLPLAVLIPFVCGLALLLWRGGVALIPWAALPALLAALTVPVDSMLTLPWLLLGSVWGLDTSGRVFLLFTALLWLGAAVYMRGYLRQRSRRFGVFFLLAMSGNLGLILAQDVLSFYLFFALMSLASYGLVIHERSQAALRAGRIYLILVLLGEVLLFAGLVMLVDAGPGGITFAEVVPAAAQSASANGIYLLLLIGFGIKAGLIGLHVWLPLAHPVAPVPASAVLSGAMIKAGLLGWLRVFPLGEAMLPDWGNAILLLGMVTAFYAALVGVLQRDPKVVLAYSSISQMGVMTLGVGAGLLSPSAWPLLFAAITLYALHHGLVKGALFLGVGISAAARGRQRPWVTGGLLVAAISMAGLPWSGGMLAKEWLKAGLLSLDAAPGWAHLLPWSALATSLLMFRFVYLAWPQRRDEAETAGGIDFRMWFGWLLLLAAMLVAPWLMAHYWLQSDAAITFAVIASLWPPGVALMIGLLLWFIRLPRPWLPAGDMIVPLETVSARLLAGGRFISQVLSRRRGALQGMTTARLPDLRTAEAWLTRWPVATSLFVLLLILLIGGRAW